MKASALKNPSRLLVATLFTVLVATIVSPPAYAQSTKSPGAIPKNEGGVEVTSANVPQDMILPSDQFKGIHFVQSDEFFSKYADPKSVPSGLYLVDTELVPKQLPAILAKNNVSLGPDDTVVNQKGEKVVLLLRYRIAKKNPVDGRFINQASPDASPFPLEYVSAWGSYQYDNGFCRSGDAYTGGDAWGPIIDPQGDRAHTNIEYMEADAWVSGGGNDDEWGYGISWEYAHSHADYGCFWPAYGAGQSGWAYFQDPGFSWFWSW